MLVRIKDAGTSMQLAQLQCVWGGGGRGLLQALHIAFWSWGMLLELGTTKKNVPRYITVFSQVPWYVSRCTGSYIYKQFGPSGAAH